jgi:hypothetical protein
MYSVGITHLTGSIVTLVSLQACSKTSYQLHHHIVPFLEFNQNPVLIKHRT